MWLYATGLHVVELLWSHLGKKIRMISAAVTESDKFLSLSNLHLPPSLSRFLPYIDNRSSRALLHLTISCVISSRWEHYSRHILLCRRWGPRPCWSSVVNGVESWGGLDSVCGIHANPGLNKANNWTKSILSSASLFIAVYKYVNK